MLNVLNHKQQKSKGDTKNLRNKKKKKRTWEMLGYVSILIVVMVSQMYSRVQTHQIAHIRYLQFSISYTSVMLF